MQSSKWLPSPVPLTVAARGVCPAVRHVRRAQSLLTFAPSSSLCASRRSIVVPRQLKAYGSTFSRSLGERSDHLASHHVLQSLSSSRTRSSPLLAKPVKTVGMDSWHELHICPALQQVVESLQLVHPSPIQQASIEVVAQRKDCVIAAPHGAGKTMAYLLPLYQNMMKDRDVYGIPLRERRPRTILLAPTQEMVEQLQSICSTLDAATGLRSISFTSRKRAKYHLSRLLKDSMADVIIMDPHVVLRLIRSRRLFLDDLRHLVVEEADAMLSSLHDHEAVHLLMKVQKRALYKYLWPVQTQFIFVSPYITRKLEYVVGRKFPSAVTCMLRKEMHRAPEGLRHRFLPIQRITEKRSVLEHLLRKHHHVPRTPQTDEEEVRAHTHPHQLSDSFAAWKRRHGLGEASEPTHPSATRENGNDAPANSTTTDATVATSPNQQDAVQTNWDDDDDDARAYPTDAAARHQLERIRPLHWGHLMSVAAPFTFPHPRTVFGDGDRTIIFFSTIDAATALFHQLRGAGYAVSLLHASLPWAVRRQHVADFASGRTNILCATDLAARGLDLHVDVIVNFDVPTNALVYLSRAGRAARMGRLGRVYSLYTKQQGVVVSAIKAFVQHDLPLEGISNQRAHMTQPRYAEWRTHRQNALSRAYVSLITSKTIPAHLERTYLRHNATWRPVFRPQTSGMHGGVAPLQQRRVMEQVMSAAVWHRRAQLARRKGGRAKFGRRDMRSGVWNDVGAVVMSSAANMSQDAHPGGPGFGPPSAPPV